MIKIKKTFAIISFMLSTTVIVAQTNSVGSYYYRLGENQKAKEYLNKELSSNPTEANFYLGEIAFKEGDMQKAEEYYRKGLSISSEDINNNIGLLKLKLKTETKEASANLDAYYYKYKKNAAVLQAIARAFLDNDMVKQAEDYLSKAKSANDKNPDIYIIEGDIIMLGNDIKLAGNAAAKYEMAIYFAPDYPLGYLKVALMYEYISSRNSIEKLETLKEKQPQLPVIYDMLGKVYTQNGFYPEAIEAYQKVIASGIYSIMDVERYARSLYFSKQYEEAQKLVDLGLQKEPTHFVLNRYDMYIQSATDNIDIGLDIANKFFTMRDTGYISLDYSTYASMLKTAKRLDEAIIQHDKALQIAPDELNLYGEAAATAREKRDYAMAAEYIRQLMLKKAELAENPEGYEDNTADINTLGYDYYSSGATIARNQALAEELMKNDKIIKEVLASDANLIEDSLKLSFDYFAKHYALYNLHKADAVFNTLIERIPDSYLGYRYKALTLHAINGETKDGLAKPYYEKVIEIITSGEEITSFQNRILLEAYNYLGYYYYVIKDNPNAIIYWNKVLEIDPENANAKLVLDALNK